jgi:hypothetical protein
VGLENKNIRIFLLVGDLLNRAFLSSLSTEIFPVPWQRRHVSRLTFEKRVMLSHCLRFPLLLFDLIFPAYPHVKPSFLHLVIYAALAGSFFVLTFARHEWEKNFAQRMR